MQYIKLEEKFMMDITQERLLARKKKTMCVFNVCESRQRKIQQIKLILRKQINQKICIKHLKRINKIR